MPFLFFQINRSVFSGIQNQLRIGRTCTVSLTRNHSLCLRSKTYLNENLLNKIVENKSILNSTRLKLIKNNIYTSQVLMEKSQLSKREQLKKAVKDYGSTVIIFHITISLASLGFFYLLISSGIDMYQIMNYFGIDFKFAQNAGTFVTAYAIHKLFAPVRISITLGATPFIVRYLRNKGILKKPSD